tara:strand:- start:1372 stop:2106 length:735 start_codon:yes stop_codon:yes gene_type:complete
MTNKYVYFVANWKMFGKLRTLDSLDKVIKFVKNYKVNKFKLIYLPPTTLLHPLIKKIKSSPIEAGGQNCHQGQNFGANTGQINSTMLKDVGAKYVILGHSEIRQLGEDEKLINLKIKSAIKSRLKVIFCIGETLKQKNKKLTRRVLNHQINKGLSNIPNKKNVIIAYEPVWAIGSGLIPKYSELSKTITYIKQRIKGAKVLYGGSVNSRNIKNLKKINNLDGFLIGGASQTSKNLIDIIKKTFN